MVGVWLSANSWKQVLLIFKIEPKKFVLSNCQIHQRKAVCRKVGVRLSANSSFLLCHSNQLASTQLSPTNWFQRSLRPCCYSTNVTGIVGIFSSLEIIGWWSKVKLLVIESDWCCQTHISFPAILAKPPCCNSDGKKRNWKLFVMK